LEIITMVGIDTYAIRLLKSQRYSGTTSLSPYIAKFLSSLDEQYLGFKHTVPS
jgi:hypothetical protein